MARTTDLLRTSRGRLLAVAAVTLLVGLGAAGTAVADEGVVEGTPCSKAARACADLGSSQAWLIKDGVVERGPVPIGQGTKDGKYATPHGDFSVISKDADHHSSEFDNAPMPWSVFFAPGGVAFHEGRTDTPSAGCIRLSTGDAQAFFHTLQVGDRVEVH